MNKDHLQHTKFYESMNPALTSSLLSKLHSNIECSICLELMVIPISIECGHSFCYGCSIEWFKNKLTCATCRYKISNKPAVNLKLRDISRDVINLLIECEQDANLKNWQNKCEEKYNKDLKLEKVFENIFRNCLTVVDNPNGENSDSDSDDFEERLIEYQESEEYYARFDDSDGNFYDGQSQEFAGLYLESNNGSDANDNGDVNNNNNDYTKPCNNNFDDVADRAYFKEINNNYNVYWREDMLFNILIHEEL